MDENGLKLQIRKFLIEANKHGYAAGVKGRKENDGSTTIVYEKGDWKYNDNFFGGEPYGGREVVFYKEEPVFVLLYYGAIKSGVSDIKKVYRFLQDALMASPESNPYRGPKIFEGGGFAYKNDWSGDLDGFHGEEIIYEKNLEIYRAIYFGGFVDRRKD